MTSGEHSARKALSISQTQIRMHDILELGKFRITIMVSVTTLAGYLLFNGKISTDLLYCLGGIFLLASGSAALNQLQERGFDARMKRTKERPLPSGRLPMPVAVTVTLFLSLAGGGLLAAGVGWTAFLLAALAYFWYNAVYTYLKRLTAYAVIPGSVIGAIPPLVGWVAAGGSLANPVVLFMALFFFTWQVPHFFLLILKYGKEYESAGFPSLSSITTDQGIRRQIFYWILATFAVTVVLPFTGLIVSMISSAGIILAGLWLVYRFSGLVMKNRSTFRPGKYFMKINYFVLFTALMMILDKTLFLHLEELLAR